MRSSSRPDAEPPWTFDWDDQGDLTSPFPAKPALGLRIDQTVIGIQSFTKVGSNDSDLFDLRSNESVPVEAALSGFALDHLSISKGVLRSN